MSESRFHKNHDQHISFSEKLTEELKEAGQNVIKQLSNMNQKKSDVLLRKVVNLVVCGILRVVPDLQDIVIKSNDQDKSNGDLKDLIQKLSRFCNEAVQEYHTDFLTLKQNLEKFLQNILLEAEALSNVIKRDDLHDFKHELVEILKDIFYTIEISLARIQVENYSNHDVANKLESLRKELFEDVLTIDNSSSEILKALHVILKYSAKFPTQFAHRFNAEASNFRNVEIQNKILETASGLHRAATDYVLVSEKTKDVKEVLAAFTKMSVNAWESCIELIDLMYTNLENTKDSENFSELIKRLISEAFVVHKHTGKNIRHDGLFA